MQFLLGEERGGRREGDTDDQYTAVWMCLDVLGCVGACLWCQHWCWPVSSGSSAESTLAAYRTVSACHICASALLFGMPHGIAAAVAITQQLKASPNGLLRLLLPHLAHRPRGPQPSAWMM